MKKKEKPEDLTYLRLRKSTLKRLQNWKKSIQEAHERRYTWDEFLDICLSDLEMIDVPGAEIYHMLYDDTADENKKSTKLPKQIIAYIHQKGYQPEDLTREEIIEVVKEYKAVQKGESILDGVLDAKSPYSIDEPSGKSQKGH